MSEADEQTGSTQGSTNPGPEPPSVRLGRWNWTDVLSQAGIPDAPGYQECLAICRAKPKPERRVKKGKRK